MSTTPPQGLPADQPRPRAKWQAARWLLRVLVPAVGRAIALLLLGVAAYFWTGLSGLALIRFDYTGLDPTQQSFERFVPIDYTGTLLNCLGPVGWIVGLGVFGFALAMALTVSRLRWPLRVLVAAAPSALLIYLAVYVSDMHPWVRQVDLVILSAEMLLAVLAAVLCRPTWRLLLRGFRQDAQGCPDSS